jgi:hypothetical protein
MIYTGRRRRWRCRGAMKPTRFLTWVLVLCAVLGAPWAAFAQEPPPAKDPTPEEIAAARELWDSGLAFERANKWEEALEKFEKVAAVKTTAQVRYHIALCHEHLGRLVDALNGYGLALQEARAAKAREVLDNAPARIEAVRGRVGKLYIRVKGVIRTSQITLDGKPIALALLDTGIPVDPGKHGVWAKRGKKIVDHATFEVEEGASANVQLTVHDPEEEPVDRPPPVPKKPPPKAPSRIPAYVVGGAGVALLIGSGVFLGLRQATIAAIEESCKRPPNLDCDAELRPTEDLGRAYGNASLGLFIPGLAALGTGVALFFVLAPPKTAQTQPATGAVSIAVTPAPGGLGLTGTF